MLFLPKRWKATSNSINSKSKNIRGRSLPAGSSGSISFQVAIRANSDWEKAIYIQKTGEHMLNPFNILHLLPPGHDGKTMSLAEFVETHGCALYAAADLLGGKRAARAVVELSERLARDPRPTRRTRQLAMDVLGVLALVNAHDDTRPEAGRFALLEPSDPRVEGICLLTDTLLEAVVGADTSLDGSGSAVKAA